MTALDMLMQHAPQARSVLEIGTRKWGENSTHHREWFPTADVYVMSDFMDGEDVDVVSDVHDLKEFDDCSFDGVFSSSLFEHVQYPWVAAQAMLRVLKPGGWCFTGTHQTFPIHGYPSDYTRWTDNGLRAVFEWAGFRVDAATMRMPCKILRPAEVEVWSEDAAAFINVATFAVKPG